MEQVERGISRRCAVVSTSTGSLDQFKKRPSDIYILRLNLHIDGERLLDEQDIKAKDVYDYMVRNPRKQVLTSPPDMDQIGELFLKLRDLGYTDVIVTTLSSVLSDTYNDICQMADLMGDSLNVHVFDTGSISIPEGHFALKASELLGRGLEVPQVLNYLKIMKKQCIIIFYLDTLKYLQRSGKATVFQNMISDIFQIKPIFQFEDSDLGVHKRVRFRQNALDTCANCAVDYINRHQRLGKRITPYLLYCGNDKLTHSFQKLLADKMGFVPDAYPLSPLVGAYIGPDAVGMGIFVEDI